MKLELLIDSAFCRCQTCGNMNQLIFYCPRSQNFLLYYGAMSKFFFLPFLVDRSLPRANTMPGGTNCPERLETTPVKPNLERSKTERRKQSIPHDDPTAQLFDDKISDKQKV